MENENTCWEKGKINKEREYIELLWREDKTLICLLQPSRNNYFIVEFNDRLNSNYVNAAEEALDYYLIELNEPYPWKYAKYHCSTASNIYSKITWEFKNGRN
jgi:hypothetical protein